MNDTPAGNDTADGIRYGECRTGALHMAVFVLFLFLFIAASAVRTALHWRFRVYLVLFGVAVVGSITVNEISAAYYQRSADDDLTSFFSRVVADHETTDVSDVVCPMVSVDALQKLVAQPGSTSINQYGGESETYRQYSVEPRVSVFHHPSNWLAMKSLDIRFEDADHCEARVLNRASL